jgi:hypothetical protein
VIEALADYDGTVAARERIVRAFESHPIIEPRHPNARGLVTSLEQRVAADPGLFRFDRESFAELDDYQAGRFQCVSLGLLRNLAPESSPGKKLSLWLFEGAGPATDIGALQASAPSRCLFQVASQFNCLEAPSPRLAEVHRYFDDPTQGPRASISAFPGTFLRHYQAPGRQGRFVQKDGSPQLNLLHKVAWESMAKVKNGYLLPDFIGDTESFANLLRDHFEDIEVGLHEDVEVVLGANWDGPVEGRRTIHQVFTSTLAAGLYGMVDFEQECWLVICRQLQRAAYLGTLLSAAATGRKYAVLTLIGGGVFGNPPPLIWDSIVWACQEVKRRLTEDLVVVVNGRNLSHSMPLDKPALDVRTLGGDVVLFDSDGVKFL